MQVANTTLIVLDSLARRPKTNRNYGRCFVLCNSFICAVTVLYNNLLSPSSFSSNPLKSTLFLSLLRESLLQSPINLFVPNRLRRRTGMLCVRISFVVLILHVRRESVNLIRYHRRNSLSVSRSSSFSALPLHLHVVVRILPVDYEKRENEK